MQQGNPELPLVSVALATYNGERYLTRQLDSLVSQTYPNLEIVVSDDGSTDRTLEILSAYSRIHPQITVYNNTGEKGVNKNFEHAVKQCKGAFIALSDQDDIWMAEKIEQLVDKIGDASLIYHDSLLVDEEGRSLEGTAVPKGYTGKDPRVFLLKNIVSGHACLFRRELLEEALPIPQAISHDWWLAAVAADNKGIRFLPEVLVHYRQHTSNASDFLDKKALNSGCTARELYLKDVTRFECFRRMRSNASFFQDWFALNVAKAGKYLCFRLFFLCILNRKSLFLLHNKSSFSIFFRCLGFLWGFKLKGVFNTKYRFEPATKELLTGDATASQPGGKNELSRVGG